MAEARLTPPPPHQLSNTLLQPATLPPIKSVPWGSPAQAPPLPQQPATNPPTLQQMQSQRTGPPPQNGDYNMGGVDSVQPSGPRLECGWNGQQGGPSDLFSEMWGHM